MTEWCLTLKEKAVSVIVCLCVVAVLYVCIAGTIEREKAKSQIIPRIEALEKRVDALEKR
jgi:hypothetical protein